MNKYEIMFYNALLVLFPVLLLAYGTGDMERVIGYYYQLPQGLPLVINFS